VYTPWFLTLKYDPVRVGTYETCSNPQDRRDQTRCYWDGETWYASSHLADRLNPVYWRGLAQDPEFPKKSTKSSPSPLRGTALVRQRPRKSPKNAWLYEDEA
jgi:hypothetical protein